MSELEKILKEMAVDEGYLTDWYINSTDDSDPVWTEEHIKELVGDFILIPKSEVRNHMNDGWISVEKELPPNSKHEGEFCPKYQVMTKYGVTEGWYNPDVKGWYVLIWFMTDRFLEIEIDFDRGDKPKVTFLPDEVNNIRHILTAWRLLPEPYQSERNKESKAGNTDAFVNEIKTLQLKQVFEVVELADKYNLDRNDVFKQYTEATISVQKTVDLENPESLSKEQKP